MATPNGILIVEDSPSLSLTYQAYLRELKEDVMIARSGEETFTLLETKTPLLILLDLQLPDIHGLEILDRLKEKDHPAAIIVITAHGSVQTAVEAMQRGAIDFLLKPFAADRLRTTARNAMHLARLHQKVEELQERKASGSIGTFIGDSPAMHAVYDMLRDAAPSRASVFVIGESGTGKELCASAIHDLSPRKAKPLVAINCAAIPATLMESEIFGHVKGAFTGATDDRIGAAEKADGGTLFLDEICEMPMDLQAKLLRFIQTGQITPVGSSQTKKVDVRFVCATNRQPLEAVQAGEFREDLYYRLHVIPIIMPPLRDRGADILTIAQSMLMRFSGEENRDFKGFSPDANDRLLAHSWPGNVRELGNVIQSAVVLNNGEWMTSQMINRILGTLTTSAPAAGSQKPIEIDHKVSTPKQKPRRSLDRPTFAPPSSDPQHDEDHLKDPDYSLKATVPILHRPRVDTIKPLDQVEREAIEDALTACNGRVRLAAQYLGINPSTLYRKIAAWEKEPETSTG